MELHEALEQEQFGIVAEEKTDQSNPAGLPLGWYKVVTASGKDAGLGFYCNACKLNVVANAPETIRHCRKVETRPGTLRELILPVHTLRAAGLAWI
jgi:hypothetical protein